MTELLIRQRPQILPNGDTWMVRDERRGPFGPCSVSREEAESWLADPVRVTVVGTLHDHQTDYTRWDAQGNRPCVCGESVSDWELHHADMIADRLRAGGLV